MGIIISVAGIRRHVAAILQRLDLAETEAELRDLAEQAWHQLFGMYRLLSDAEGSALNSFDQVEESLDLLAQALKTVEAIFDEACFAESSNPSIDFHPPGRG